MFHVGGPGAGHIIKLLNNFIAQAICTATAEAFAVGARAGIDLRQLVALISVGAVNSGLFQMMSKTLDGEMGALRFELDNARKDIRYYTHLAEGLAIPTVMGEAVHQSLALASALGHGKKFVPSLVEAQEQLTGATIVPRRGLRRARRTAPPVQRACFSARSAASPRRRRRCGSGGAGRCPAAGRAARRPASPRSARASA